MGVFCRRACRHLKNVRRVVLAFLLAILISLEIPDVSVVRAQEVPALYANAQRGAGNSSWISQLTNPFSSLFPGQQTVLPTDRPQGFSFMAEGLYMDLRSDSQVFSQSISTTTTRTYLGALVSSVAPGNFESVKPDRVRGLRVGLGYTFEDWDARVLYSRYRAEPESEQAAPGQATLHTYFGATTSQNQYNAATAPIVSLNNYQAEAGFNANVWDFQAGYAIRLGQLSTARLFGGISYVETENTLEGTGAPAAGSSLSVDRRTWFRAWGPKIGLDLDLPLGSSGFSLRGEGAVGGLFGTQKLTVNNKVFGGAAAQFEDSNRQNIVSLEGEAGIGYSFPGMELTLGYRVERFSTNNLSYVNVGASFPPGSLVRTGNTRAIQYLEGGFLRLEMKL